MKLQVTVVNPVGGVNVVYHPVKDQSDALVAVKAMIALRQVLYADSNIYFDYGDFRFNTWMPWKYVNVSTFRDILEWNDLGEYSVAHA